MIIKFSKSFDKMYRKMSIKVQDKFNLKLITFEADKFDKQLNNHSLNGKYEGKRPINITGDYRAIFIEKNNGIYEFVEFTNIGTFSIV